MTWFLLALASAIFQALFTVLTKHFLKRTHERVLNVATGLNGGLIMLAISYLHGFPALGPDFLWSFGLNLIVGTLGAITFIRALALHEASLVAPFIALSPFFTTAGGWLLLTEVPSLAGITGIVLAGIGAFIIQYQRRAAAALDRRAKQQAILLGVTTAILWGIGANLGKITILNSDALFTTATGALGTSGLLYAYARLTNFSRFGAEYVKHFWPLLLTGAMLALGSLASNLAFTLQLSAYVMTVKRASVLFTVLLGALFLKEKHLSRRLLGAAIIVLGTILLLVE